jgi:chaperone required for assembly of F1-ATPase
MSAWKPKRFWKAVTIHPHADGFAVHLDARHARTPGKAPLILPSRAMADAVAAEWQAQQGLVKPETMPFTRGANTAIDKVAPQMGVIVADLASYGGTDLLCYRATGPQALVDRQNAGWNPLLDWSAEALNAPLHHVPGVMHIAQPEASLARLHALVAAMQPFQITGFHDLVQLSGSLILALAVTRGRLTPDAAWGLSRIDETWQIEAWGDDEDAAATVEIKRLAFHQAVAFWSLSAPN